MTLKFTYLFFTILLSNTGGMLYVFITVYLNILITKITSIFFKHKKSFMNTKSISMYYSLKKNQFLLLLFSIV
jgi:hypothetical protein